MTRHERPEEDRRRWSLDPDTTAEQWRRWGLDPDEDRASGPPRDPEASATKTAPAQRPGQS